MLDHNWFTIPELEEVLPQRDRFQSVEEWIIINSDWFVRHIDGNRVFECQVGDVEQIIVKVQLSIYEDVEEIVVKSQLFDLYGNIPDRYMHW